MDNTNRISVKFNTKIEPIKELNSEFTLCKCYVQGCGKNRNFTYMSKDNVEKFKATLNYAPVVGHLYKDENDKYHMGGHDMTIDENFNFVMLTIPFGVVKEDSFEYETVNEYGADVEYLTTNIILWTGRYPELKEAIYSDNTWFNQSMEINVSQYRPLEEDSNYTELLEWEYSALCLLGKSDNTDENVEPCFINSKVQPYQFELNNEFTEKFTEMKKAISICFSNNAGGEKEEMTEERIAEILAEFKIAKEDLDFEITLEMSEEEIKEKLEAFKCGNKKKKFNENGDGETAQSDDIKTSDEQELSEPQIDYCSEYEKLKSEYDILISELEELREFKADVETKAAKAQREADEAEVFTKFDESLADVAEYAELKSHSADYEIKALEKECYALIGMYAVKGTTTDEPMKFSLDTTKEEKVSPYGDAFKKYGKK